MPKSRSSSHSDFDEKTLGVITLKGDEVENLLIGLHSHYRLTSTQNQLETLQHLSFDYPETVDLVLATADGAIEPVHAFYLALKAPKFWDQQIVPKIKNRSHHGEPSTVHRLRTSENLINEVPRVLLTNIDGQMLHIIVGSIYHRVDCLKLDYALAWQLLAVGRDFELDFLLKKCFKCLAGQLSAGNAVHVMQVGLHFGHQPLATAAYRYILLNFHDILQTRGPGSLTELTLRQLTALLADDHLNIANELDAFRAVVKWVMHLPATRLAYFWSPLFLHVRTQVMPKTSWPLMAHLFSILERPEYDPGKVLQAKSVLAGVHWPLPLFNPRVPRTVIFIYGGFEGGLPSSTLKTFDVRSGRCFSISLPNAPSRVYHATVALQGSRKGLLMLLGGTDGFEVLNSVVMLNLTTGRFRAASPMSERRSHLSAVVVTENNVCHSVIVMGGSNNTSGSLRSCEKFDCITKVWLPLPPMQTPRKEAAAMVHGNKVYISGGVDAFCNSSVEVLTMAASSGGNVNYIWTVVSFMNVPRRGHALLSSGDALYAIGGCTDVNEYTCLRSVEKLSTNGNNQWEFAPPMTAARHAAAAVSLEGKLFVFGGYDGASCSKSIECYNAASANSAAAGVQWEVVDGCQLPTETSSGSSATLSDLPTAMHLTYYGQCLLQGQLYEPTKARKKYSHKTVAGKIIAACKKENKAVKHLH